LKKRRLPASAPKWKKKKKKVQIGGQEKNSEGHHFLPRGRKRRCTEGVADRKRHGGRRKTSSPGKEGGKTKVTGAHGGKGKTLVGTVQVPFLERERKGTMGGPFRPERYGRNQWLKTLWEASHILGVHPTKGEK